MNPVGSSMFTYSTPVIAISLATLDMSLFIICLLLRGFSHKRSQSQGYTKTSYFLNTSQYKRDF